MHKSLNNDAPKPGNASRFIERSTFDGKNNMCIAKQLLHVYKAFINEINIIM